MLIYTDSVELAEIILKSEEVGMCTDLLSQKTINKISLRCKSMLMQEIARTVSDRFSSLCTDVEQECARSLQVYEAYIVEIHEKQKMVEDSIKMQKKAQAMPSQSMLIDFMASFADSKGLFTVTVPK